MRLVQPFLKPAVAIAALQEALPAADGRGLGILGRLAMTKYGLKVCGAHGGYAAAARMGLRKPSRKYLLFKFRLLAMRGMEQS